MSVQLILYPQNYDGQYNSISTTTSEFVIDGDVFTTIDTSSSYDSPTPLTGNVIGDVLTNASPNIANTWYRFRSTDTGTPTLPTVVAAVPWLVIIAVPTSSIAGVYQRLSNLTIGQQYILTVANEPTGFTGTAYVAVYNGSNNNSIAANFANTNTSPITLTFTAATTSDIILISWIDTTNSTMFIYNISVSQVGSTPTTVYTELQDGQVICDLYEDEDIPLTLSVDDFKNVAEKVQSYSKAFNLPATKRNNQIFDSIFEVTRTDTGLNFNPYKKTQCVLKQDGFILFEGYLRLIDIQDKEGEISYNVNLYSEVVALADVLKDRTFSDLDFSELEHDYNYTEIRNSWQGILGLNSPLPVGTYAGTAGASTTAVLRYPFVDWSHSFSVGSSNFPVLPNLESVFRPFISIKYLIDRIFAASPFTYTSDFFDIAGFGKLYMDFNWGSDTTPNDYELSGQAFNYTSNNDTIPLTWSAVPTDQTYITNYFSSDFGYNDTTGFTAINSNTTYDVEFRVWFRGEAGAKVATRILHTEAATGNTTPYDYTDYEWSGFNDVTTTKNITIPLNVGDNLQLQAIALNQVNGYPTIPPAGLVSNGDWTVRVIATISINVITTSVMLQTLRGELGQWEFLKGLMTMFNLVTLPDPDNPTNILIEPYNDVFLENDDSTQLDWTDKIDITEMKLTPLTELNKRTIFKFVEDDDDYAFNIYKNATSGHLYGSKKQDEVFYTILDGEKEIVAEPFAATIPKPLMSQFPDFITPAVYAMSNDGTSEGFDNSPRIMYNNGVKTLTSCTYSVPTQNGVAGDAFEDEFLQFSHLTDIPTSVSIPPTSGDTVDFNFETLQTLGGIGTTPYNLYSMYWEPYYNELYNPDTRTMTIKVNLSPSDINTFKFYDIITIKNREFRVNKIDYKPNDLATVEFILIP